MPEIENLAQACETLQTQVIQLEFEREIHQARIAELEAQLAAEQVKTKRMGLSEADYKDFSRTLTASPPPAKCKRSSSVGDVPKSSSLWAEGQQPANPAGPSQKSGNQPR